MHCQLCLMGGGLDRSPPFVFQTCHKFKGNNVLFGSSLSMAIVHLLSVLLCRDGSSLVVCLGVSGSMLLVQIPFPDNSPLQG